MRWSLLLAVVASACGGSSTPTAPTPPAVTPQSLSISGAVTLTARNQQAPLTAILTQSDRSTIDRTTQATWTTSDPSVLAVNNVGVVTALRSGSAEITATFQTLAGKASIGVAIPCEINNTASAAFRNTTDKTSMDIVLDGARLVSVAPHDTSAPYTVAAGTAHVLDFFVAGSPTNRVCASSRPILPQCSTATISCP